MPAAGPGMTGRAAERTCGWRAMVSCRVSMPSCLLGISCSVSAGCSAALRFLTLFTLVWSQPVSARPLPAGEALGPGPWGTARTIADHPNILWVREPIKGPGSSRSCREGGGWRRIDGAWDQTLPPRFSGCRCSHSLLKPPPPPSPQVGDLNYRLVQSLAPDDVVREHLAAGRLQVSGGEDYTENAIKRPLTWMLLNLSRGA